MANTSESTRRFQKLEISSDASGSTGAPSDSEYFTPVASESEPATTSSAAFSSARAESVEDVIERSKVHWSQLREYYDSDDDEVAEVSNVEVFKSLQMHPTCGTFFKTFGDGGIHDAGELEVGEKFAEGGQGELFNARVTWKRPEDNDRDKQYGHMWVLKVFGKGTFLKQLRNQWSQGLFRDYQEREELRKRGKSQLIRFNSVIHCGTLLPDGRFAFLLLKETGDLRNLINREMQARTSLDRGPFTMARTIVVMYRIAQGMLWLHNHDSVHRDLKAANVLFSRFNDSNGKDIYAYSVADFECSIGVVGTGFFRAPEILQAVKDRVVSKRPDLFTKAADVYSYGMICYEILTGKFPFEGHATNDFDLVLKGQRPEVPHYVEEWARDLLSMCWQSNPEDRPKFEEILSFLEANSAICKKLGEGTRSMIEKMELDFGTFNPDMA